MPGKPFSDIIFPDWPKITHLSGSIFKFPDFSRLEKKPHFPVLVGTQLKCHSWNVNLTLSHISACIKASLPYHPGPCISTCMWLTLLTSMFIVETTKSGTQRPVDYGGKMVPLVKCHIIKMSICHVLILWKRHIMKCYVWNVMIFFAYRLIRWLCSWKMKVNCTQNTGRGYKCCLWYRTPHDSNTPWIPSMCLSIKRLSVNY